MKKLIFTITLALGLVAMLQAQVAIKPSFGLNSTHLTTEHVDWKSQGRLGYQFGVGVLVGDKFYFEPGIYWATVSQDLTNTKDENPQPETFKNTISSMRVPVCGSNRRLARISSPTAIPPCGYRQNPMLSRTDLAVLAYRQPR